MGSPSDAGNGDRTFALLFVLFIIFVHTAWGSTIPFIVTSFLSMSITTPSTPDHNNKQSYIYITNYQVIILMVQQ